MLEQEFPGLQAGYKVSTPKNFTTTLWLGRWAINSGGGKKAAAVIGPTMSSMMTRWPRGFAYLN